MPKYREINDEIPPQHGTELSTASLILGIIALALMCIWQITITLSIVGVVLGIIAIIIKSSGRNLAIAGLICNIAALTTIILLL